LCDVGWVSCPDRFSLVELLLLDLGLFDFLGLRLLFLLFFFVIINLFDLGILLVVVLNFFGILIWDFLLGLLENVEVDGI